MKVTYMELQELFEQILIRHGFGLDQARLCASVFSENTLIGVASHGINRFPDFIGLVKRGYIIPSATPSRISAYKALEQWDGNYGPGPLNALKMTEKVISLARKYGIGCVALRNTNHWMRPGYYAWQAAERGYIFICWTNTIPIMPPWGAETATIGNNPLVIGMPRKQGPLVLDMALSQYSYGKMEEYALENKALPYHGGYDRKGKLTKNAREICDSKRPLPIGYWKGAALALILDTIAAILAAGKSTFDLSRDEVETGVSQVYIAIHPAKFSSTELADRVINEILQFYLSAKQSTKEKIRYPGERIMKLKKKNFNKKIDINDDMWKKVYKLLSNN